MQGLATIIFCHIIADPSSFPTQLSVSLYLFSVLRGRFGCKTVVTCKIKHLQKMFQCFILHVTTSKMLFKMFYAKTFATMLQNIFSRIEHGVKIHSGYM